MNHEIDILEGFLSRVLSYDELEQIKNGTVSSTDESVKGLASECLVLRYLLTSLITDIESKEEGNTSLQIAKDFMEKRNN